MGSVFFLVVFSFVVKGRVLRFIVIFYGCFSDVVCAEDVYVYEFRVIREFKYDLVYFV